MVFAVISRMELQAEMSGFVFAHSKIAAHSVEAARSNLMTTGI